MPVLTRDAHASTSDFEPCPEGDLQLVVVDVVDLGWQIKTYEGTPQGYFPFSQIVYQAVGEDDDGVPVLRDDDSRYLVFGRRCPVSLDNRANFYKEISGILGEKKFNEQLDAGTFDTENLIGLNVLASIVHTESNGRIYANIENMRPWTRKMGEPLGAEGYTRRHERDGYQPPLLSCWCSVDAARQWFTEQGEEFRPKKDKAPDVQPAPKPAPDPRAVNPSPAERQKARKAEMAAQTLSEEMDDEDPFRDE